MMTNQIPEVLSTADVERFFGIPRSTQAKRRISDDHFIPFFKVGDAVRYRRIDVEQWIADQIESR